MSNYQLMVKVKLENSVMKTDLREKAAKTMNTKEKNTPNPKQTPILRMLHGNALATLHIKT
jgi:hypothetical protein